MYVTWKRLCPLPAAARSRKNQLPSTQSQRVPRTIGFPGKQRPRGLISFSAMILDFFDTWSHGFLDNGEDGTDTFFGILCLIMFEHHEIIFTAPHRLAPPNHGGWTNERCTNEPVSILECPEFSSTPKFILRGSLTWTPQNVNHGSP